MADFPVQDPELFWLHIKKCGGGSVRKALAPTYKLAERNRRPVNFIQSDPALWNDILNNFRVPLGAYQFRRALFAKQFLYTKPDQWERLFRFAFVRDPVARAVSMFFYLSSSHGGHLGFPQVCEANGKVVPQAIEKKFDLFLNLVNQSHNSPSNDGPVNLHFSTHTAAAYGDVTDEDGTVLLSHIFRLDDLGPVIDAVRERFGLAPFDMPLHNQRDAEDVYVPSAAQKARIERIFAKDFELFDTAKGVADL